jgi:hypothetical protein
MREHALRSSKNKSRLMPCLVPGCPCTEWKLSTEQPSPFAADDACPDPSSCSAHGPHAHRDDGTYYVPKESRP